MIHPLEPDKMMKYRIIILGLLAVICAAGIATPAFAVPNLQIYIDGGTYDTTSQTWVTSSSNFELWVIGAKRAMHEVKLAIAVPSSNGGTVTVNLTEIVISTTPGTPIMGNGSSLPSHSIYSTYFGIYDVGNFDLSQTVYDMQPGETGSANGEIKKFSVLVSGYDWVHFDAYGHYHKCCKIHYRKAPFSHDAEYVIPEPGSLLLLGSGLLGLMAFRKNRV
ncbi:MAG: choice-of-anchor N protein [Candidatus Omnitrophota bacterium]